MSSSNFSKGEFKNRAKGFSSPTQRPSSEEERKQWQEANKKWWGTTPMRYDWRDEIAFPEHSVEYFAEVDRRFFLSSEPYLPYKSKPFEREIPYDELGQMDVLEIGVGQGSHASLIAPLAKSYTGIDLTEPAVESTSKRMAQLDIDTAKIIEMDAEKMSFDDESFDYIWSWGVIHHSADTRSILEQMNRVLKPGGRANVMIYHRSWWKYYVMDGFFKGIILGQRRNKSLHEVNQAATDGAIARYYTMKEWAQLTDDLFAIDEFRIYGLKNDVIPLPAGRLKEGVEKVVPDVVCRLLTNKMRWGSFLTVHMTKKAVGKN